MNKEVQEFRSSGVQEEEVFLNHSATPRSSTSNWVRDAIASVSSVSWLLKRTSF
jgi:hypothetical protein